MNPFLHVLLVAIVVLNGNLLHGAENAAAPRTAREWNAQGIKRSRDNEPQQAIEAFSEAIKSSPEQADPYVNRAIVYIGLKDWQTAESDCTKAIELDADNARAYHQRAVVRSQMGQHDAAFKDASRAVRMEPADPNIVFTRYLACSRSGRHELGHFSGETYIGLRSWSDTWSPYMALLNSISLRRAGYEEESRAILTETTQWLKRESWPMPLVLYLRGDIDAAVLMEETNNDNDRMTLAHYYVGVNEWLNDDAATAGTHFEWVRDQGNSSFLQHMLAEDHLKELDTAGSAAQ